MGSSQPPRQSQHQYKYLLHQFTDGTTCEIDQAVGGTRYSVHDRLLSSTRGQSRFESSTVQQTSLSMSDLEHKFDLSSDLDLDNMSIIKGKHEVAEIIAERIYNLTEKELLENFHRQTIQKNQTIQKDRTIVDSDLEDIESTEEKYGKIMKALYLHPDVDPKLVKRTTQVRYYCDPDALEPVIQSVIEPHKCAYIMSIAMKSLCAHPFFKIQSSEYQEIPCYESETNENQELEEKKSLRAEKEAETGGLMDQLDLNPKLYAPKRLKAQKDLLQPKEKSGFQTILTLKTKPKPIPHGK